MQCRENCFYLVQNLLFIVGQLLFTNTEDAITV